MPSAAHTQRLDFRLNAANRRLIERAATILGQPLTAFAVKSLLTAAEAVIEQDSQRKLSDRDRRRFLAALDQDRPIAALARAARRYKARYRGADKRRGSR
ncbi:MAG: DUF1778 domain-containing protein [Myxococcales bacterium]|nr:DUF1778 domain-containing protein [Myxococcales bacterium]